MFKDFLAFLLFASAFSGLSGVLLSGLLLFEVAKMGKEYTDREENTNTTRTLRKLSVSKNASWAGFVFLLVLYVLASIALIKTSSSEEVFVVNGQPIPLRTMTGAFSSVANICIIFLAVFYGKPGFVTSMVILIAQFPNVLYRIIGRHEFTIIPGVFTNALTILAIFLIYANNNKVQKFQDRIRRQAVTDRLTGLPNRFACSELMSDLVRNNSPFAIASFNLNSFKSINSTMGYHAGNDVLVEIASRFRKAADAGSSGTLDFVTCQGGDEFSLIIRGFRSEDDILKTIRHYESVLEERLTLDGCDYYMTASIGYAVFPKDTKDSESLLSYANTAMFAAKETGSICRFTPDLVDDEKSIEIEQKIRNALNNDLLFFHLQPQYTIDHVLRGFEALARMKDTDGNMISPGEFVPVAEKAGIIDRIDYLVFRKAASFFGELLKKTDAKLTLSVNVSVKHLMKNDFLDEVREILRICDVPADQLEIEITESIMIDSVERALQCIRELKRMGIKIAIDDFGTGYSALSYLSTFPADMLKVDKSFIDKMNSSESSKQYVAAIISIGHIMNFDVISEGVEEPEQLDTLKSIGCDYIQGFIWGRPLDKEAAEKLVLCPECEKGEP